MLALPGLCSDLLAQELALDEVLQCGLRTGPDIGARLAGHRYVKEGGYAEDSERGGKVGLLVAVHVVEANAA